MLESQVAAGLAQTYNIFRHLALSQNINRPDAKGQPTITRITIYCTWSYPQQYVPCCRVLVSLNWMVSRRILCMAMASGFLGPLIAVFEQWEPERWGFAEEKIFVISRKIAKVGHMAGVWFEVRADCLFDGDNWVVFFTRAAQQMKSFFCQEETTSPITIFSCRSDADATDRW